MEKNEFIGYAFSFTSFLLKELGKDTLKLNKIILFGSAARGEVTEESDIDIFIDGEPVLKKKIDALVDKFYRSKDYALFRVQGIENPISVKVGKLIEWKELHRSIVSTGIILYGPFETEKVPVGSKHEAIFYWDKIDKNRGAFLNKVYGFRSKDKKYAGLLEKWNGQKIGKSSILIPIQHKEEMITLLKKYKVNSKLIEVFSLD